MDDSAGYKGDAGNGKPRCIFKADSIDKPLDHNGDSETTRGDMLEDYRAGEAFENVEQRAYIEELRAAFSDIDDQLTDEQQAIIRARYYDGLNMTETAERLRKTAAQCRTQERAAIQVYRKQHNVVRLALFYIGYGGIGFTAFRQRQASAVELAVERLDRLRPLADKVSPERRARWEREREQAKAAAEWHGYMPDYFAERWKRYVEHGGDRPTV